MHFFSSSESIDDFTLIFKRILKNLKVHPHLHKLVREMEMHLHYTKKNIRKLFKKSIKKEIVDNLLISMAKNCDYTKRDIVNTVIFAVSNNIFVEYGSKHLRGKGKPSPSSDDVFYHLNKLTKKDVVWLFNQVNHNLLSQAKKTRCLQEEYNLWFRYT